MRRARSARRPARKSTPRPLRQEDSSSFSSLRSPLLFDGDTPERARIVRIDQRRRMQQRGVVPDDDVAYAVLQTVVVLLLRRVSLQLVEQVDRLVLGHALDAEGAAGHGLEGRAPGERGLPRDGMAHTDTYVSLH